MPREYSKEDLEKMAPRYVADLDDEIEKTPAVEHLMVSLMMLAHQDKMTDADPVADLLTFVWMELACQGFVEPNGFSAQE